jgi:hypothetical protein
MPRTIPLALAVDLQTAARNLEQRRRNLEAAASPSQISRYADRYAEALDAHDAVVQRIREIPDAYTSTTAAARQENPR